MPLDESPSLSPAETAAIDFQRQREAMAKRMQTFGVTQAPADPDTITDYDRALFGRPVRIEVDVTVPLDELRRQLNTIRAELTNAIAELERGGPVHDRRFSVHRRLCAAKVYVFRSRQEIKLRRRAQDK
jgi:hypothetical protein